MSLSTKIIEAEVAVFEPPAVELRAHGDDRRAARRSLQLLSVLQTALDLEQLLRLFSTGIRQWVPHSSLAFVNPARGIGQCIGTPAAHARDYHLVVGGEPVGQVVLTRGQPFERAETVEFEHLLSALVYPLRNALTYRDALESAHTDCLTDLHNRSAMDRAMAREVALAQRHGTPLSLLIADIDDFKHTNDELGHAAGDQTIRCVADAIAGCVRGTDFVARYGGEEFTILARATGMAGAGLLAERIRGTVEATPCRMNGARVTSTVSIGIACLREGESALGLFERADRAMYAAKRAGKNCVRSER
jgi:diguanylate cyclase (GGDEF)-like protein